MKKFLALCLAAMMALASASLIAADDGIMLISEAPAVAEEVVVTGVKAPATTPLFGLLRTVKVNVEATEGGKVSVPSKFVAALTSTRAFTVTPDESYEVADIIVNGVSYGPAYKVVLKNIAVNTDVKVVFQQKLVEVFTPVYAETFDGETKWVAGGHMESAAAADGVLNAVSVGGDPNINYPEAFGLNCDDIDAIRIKLPTTPTTLHSRFSSPTKLTPVTAKLAPSELPPLLAKTNWLSTLQATICGPVLCPTCVSTCPTALVPSLLTPSPSTPLPWKL